MDVDEPSEEDEGGLILRHIYDNGQYSSVALNSFMYLETNWWGELQNLGFAFPRAPPEWRQRQLRAIFGNLDIPSP